MITIITEVRKKNLGIIPSMKKSKVFKEIFGYVCPYFAYGRRLGRDLCRAKGPEDREKTPSEGLLRREDIDRVRFLSRDHNRSLLVTAETKDITRFCNA